MQKVFCGVPTEFLNITPINFRLKKDWLVYFFKHSIGLLEVYNTGYRTCHELNRSSILIQEPIEQKQSVYLVYSRIFTNVKNTWYYPRIDIMYLELSSINF